MSTLFISHSSRDNEAARELQARLEERGHRSLFLDLDPEKGIQAGTSWERTLYTKLRACRAVVALCSDHYLASHWTFAEVALARMEGKAIFALLVEPWSDGAELPSILTQEQFIDLRANLEEGYTRLWNGFKATGIVPAERREWRPDQSPYPGLRAFEEADAPIFFGRDREAQEGVELLSRCRRLGHPRLVTILGASGSGKSSLARAGIVPRLRLAREEWVLIGPLRPGTRPFRHLAAAWSAAFREAGRPLDWREIEKQLPPPADGDGAPPADEDGPGSDEDEPTTALAVERLLAALASAEAELAPENPDLARSLERLRRKILAEDEARRGTSPESAETAAPGPDEGSPVAPAEAEIHPLVELAETLRLEAGAPRANVVLLLDQFEEALGQANPDHPSNVFLRLLRDGLEAEGSPLLALATMRSDFLDAFQRSPPLVGIGFKSLSVGPLAVDAMREVVVEPARLGQIELEEGLPELLLADTGTSDALPLLAFTLRVMWERLGRDRRFGIEEYRRLGGLQGAVARVAEETFEAARRLGDEASLRDAFLRLVRPTEKGTGWARQAAAWDELAPEVRPMLELFVAQRLLVRRPDGRVEVAHEALFRSWSRLREWLRANREGLLLLHDIRASARKWRAAESEEERAGYLWRGGRLARAVELRDGGVMALEGRERSFLEASEGAVLAEERRERRRNRMLLASVAFALVIAIAFIFYMSIKNRMIRSKELAGSSGRMLGEDSQLGLLLAIEAARAWPSVNAERALRDAMSQPGRATRLFERHRGEVVEVSFNRDGSRLASASLDGARVWDPVTGKEVSVLGGHDARILDVNWAPDGIRLASASIDGTARVWNAETGAELAVLAGHRARVRQVAWSEDGKRIATASDDGTARTWDAASGQQLRVFPGHQNSVSDVAWLGERVATVSFDRMTRVWDPRTGGEPAVFGGHRNRVRYLAWNAASGLLATASDDSTARVWGVDGGRGEAVAVLAGHGDQLTAVEWSPDGRFLLTASRDGTARIWDRDDWHEAQVLSVGEQVTRATWHPEGGQILTADRGGRVRIWDGPGTAERGAQRVTLTGHRGPVADAVWSPSGGAIATAGADRTVRLWDPHAHAELATLRHGPAVWAAAWSPDDRFLVTGGAGGTVTLWEVGEGGGRKDLEGAAADVLAVGWLPDGSAVWAVGRGREAWMWDAASGRPRAALVGHASGLVTGAASPDGHRLAAAGFDRAVHLWDTASGRHLGALEGHRSVIHHVEWSRSGGKLLSASGDGTVRTWDPEALAPLQKLAGHGSSVWHATWSPDEKRIVSVSSDRTARLWSADTGEPVGAPLDGFEDWLWHAAWSHSGRRVTLVGRVGETVLWDPESGATLRIGHRKDQSREARWSPDDRRVLVFGDTPVARLWDPSSGDVIALLRGHRRRLTGAEWSPDGRRLLTISADGTVALHLAEVEDLLDLACRQAVRNLTLEEWNVHIGGGYRTTCDRLPSREEG